MRKIVFILISFVIFSSISCKKLATDVYPNFVGERYRVRPDPYYYDMLKINENGHYEWEWYNPGSSDRKSGKVRIEGNQIYFKGLLKDLIFEIIESPTTIDTLMPPVGAGFSKDAKTSGRMILESSQHLWTYYRIAK